MKVLSFLALPLLLAQSKLEIVGIQCKQQREDDQRCSVTLNRNVSSDQRLLVILRGQRSKELVVQAGQNTVKFTLPEYDRIETVSVIGEGNAK